MIRHGWAGFLLLALLLAPTGQQARASEAGAKIKPIAVGTPLPRGISLSDPATFTLTVTVVRQP